MAYRIVVEEAIPALLRPFSNGLPVEFQFYIVGNIILQKV